MNNVKNKKPIGLLAQFDDPAALMHAAEKVRDAGYKKFDCHSPFPIHGMDEAMGLKRSPLGWMVGIMSLIGAALGIVLQWWTSAVNYPLVIAGKPFFSYQAFVPVTFGLAVLFGAVTALFGMLFLNKLPKPYHPVFYSDNFSRFSDDAFFVSIQTDDPRYEKKQTEEFLKSIGGKSIEYVSE